MSETNQIKPCVLFILPPMCESLDDYCEALESAGYEVCMFRYGKAADEVLAGDLWDWIKAECQNLEAVIWPGIDFYDPWVCDSIASANGQISEVIETLKQQGAAEINARYEWGGACADTVVMYGPPEVFVREVVSAIELNKKRLMSQQ